jgi:hypothetical protein
MVSIALGVGLGTLLFLTVMYLLARHSPTSRERLAKAWALETEQIRDTDEMDTLYRMW